MDMRGIQSWEGHEPACSDPRVMYVFNVLADAFSASVDTAISDNQCNAICEAVCANIPDRETAIAYHKRFRYPLGKGSTKEDSKEQERLYDELMKKPLSQEKIDFLLSLIK